MTITMTELAKKLNLSQPTVSRALNHKEDGHMKPELATKIREAARLAGYHPNFAAKVLREGKSDQLGVSLPTLKLLRNAELATALHHAIWKHGYLPFFAFHENYDDLNAKTMPLLSMNLAGLITVEPNSLPSSPGIPVVGFYYYDDRFDLLQLDLESMIRNLFDYLRSLGHTKVAVIGHAGDIRYNYFFQLAEEYGIICPPQYQVMFSDLFRNGGEFFDELLKQCRDDKPTAILAHNDQIAFAVMRRIHELGYTVPGDFSVIGGDNIALSQSAIPALTSLCLGNPEKIANTMVDLLLNRRNNPDIPIQQIIIKPELIIRESCGKPAIG